MASVAPPSIEDDDCVYFDIDRKADSTVKFSRDGTKTVINTHIETILGYSSQDQYVSCMNGTPNIHFTRKFVEEIVYRPDLPEAQAVVTTRSESLHVQLPRQDKSSFTSESTPDSESGKSVTEEVLEARQFLDIVEVIEPASLGVEAEDPDGVEERKEPEVETYTRTRIVVEKYA